MTGYVFFRVRIAHLNFKIEKGQIYGFLGPNGAGKSTTMNIMTGYLGATEGGLGGYQSLHHADGDESRF